MTFTDKNNKVSCWTLEKYFCLKNEIWCLKVRPNSKMKFNKLKMYHPWEINLWPESILGVNLSENWKAMESMSELKKRLSFLTEKYRSTFTVPEHPAVCAECGSQVKMHQINFEEAVWFCSEKMVSLVSGEVRIQIIGKSKTRSIFNRFSVPLASPHAASRHFTPGHFTPATSPPTVHPRTLHPRDTSPPGHFTPGHFTHRAT